MNPPTPPNNSNRPPAGHSRSGEGSDWRARVDELLADRATQGLSPGEEAELDGLLEAHELPLDHGLERAAAAADLAMSAGEARGAMPEAVRRKLLAMGQEWARRARAGELAEESGRLHLTSLEPQEAALFEPKAPARTIRFGDRVLRVVGSWGGWAAAAATLAVAALYSTHSPEKPVRGPLSLVERYDRMLENSKRDDNVVEVAGASDETHGELVYDSRKHEGILAIAGLDPSAGSGEQYQVWLVDASRNEPYPVNGGVFDVKSVQNGAKILVPINPQLPVKAPVGWAISKEPRGGSVVSHPDRIIASGSLPQPGPPAPEAGMEGPGEGGVEMNAP